MVRALFPERPRVLQTTSIDTVMQPNLLWLIGEVFNCVLQPAVHPLLLSPAYKIWLTLQVKWSSGDSGAGASRRWCHHPPICLACRQTVSLSLCSPRSNGERPFPCSSVSGRSRWQVCSGLAPCRMLSLELECYRRSCTFSRLKRRLKMYMTTSQSQSAWSLSCLGDVVWSWSFPLPQFSPHQIWC